MISNVIKMEIIRWKCVRLLTTEH